MLSDEQIKEFQVLYKDRFGTEISRAAACEKGIKLVRLIELICKPMTEKENQNLIK
jgi:allophanate hydrolase subunit 1